MVEFGDGVVEVLAKCQLVGVGDQFVELGGLVVIDLLQPACLGDAVFGQLVVGEDLGRGLELEDGGIEVLTFEQGVALLDGPVVGLLVVLALLHLLARYGGSLGKVFFAEEGAYNVAMAKVVYLFDKDLVYQNFLYWYYKGNLYQDLVKGNNRSAQGGFNKDDLSSLLFPLPPLAEQHRIVEKLEQLLGKIDKLKK